jgi:acyl-CoA thioester hydrolase
MLRHETMIRVGYADTDPMGFVHHSNYMRYFENARGELFRKLGLNYREMEKNGIQMPVLSFHINFMHPAYFDDLLSIRVFIKEQPKAKIKFEYETYNQSGLLINTGETILCFMNSDTKKACFPPQNFKTVIEELFKKNEFIN